MLLLPVIVLLIGKEASTDCVDVNNDDEIICEDINFIMLLWSVFPMGGSGGSSQSGSPTDVAHRDGDDINTMLALSLIGMLRSLKRFYPTCIQVKALMAADAV